MDGLYDEDGQGVGGGNVHEQEAQNKGGLHESLRPVVCVHIQHEGGSAEQHRKTVQDQHKNRKNLASEQFLSPPSRNRAKDRRP